MSISYYQNEKLVYEHNCKSHVKSRKVHGHKREMFKKSLMSTKRSVRISRYFFQ